MICAFLSVVGFASCSVDEVAGLSVHAQVEVFPSGQGHVMTGAVAAASGSVAVVNVTSVAPPSSLAARSASALASAAACCACCAFSLACAFASSAAC